MNDPGNYTDYMTCLLGRAEGLKARFGVYHYSPDPLALMTKRRAMMASMNVAHGPHLHVHATGMAAPAGDIFSGVAGRPSARRQRNLAQREVTYEEAFAPAPAPPPPPTAFDVGGYQVPRADQDGPDVYGVGDGDQGRITNVTRSVGPDPSRFNKVMGGVLLYQRRRSTATLFDRDCLSEFSELEQLW